MSESSNTEKLEGVAPTHELGKRVKLPEKLSSLRQKLGQKAKQEPNFRFYTLYERIALHSQLRVPKARAYGRAVCGKSARTVR